MPSRAPNRSTPTVMGGALYSDAATQDAALPVGGPAWDGWLADAAHTTFYFADSAGSFTARRETRRGQAYWYAYRKRHGALHKTYLGKPADLTLARMHEAAAALGRSAPAAGRPAPVADAEMLASLPVAPGAGEQPDLPLLATKLQIPAAPPTRVRRPRLSGRLDATWRYALTLVVAPAGFGKTTLVSTWASGCGQPVAWVSLDAGDRDPGRFRQYLVAALARLLAGAGAVAPDLSGGAGRAELTRLLNAWPAGAPASALVLDDYHAADAPAAHEMLTFLIDHLPPTLHVLLTSRGEPPLPLARWRGRGLVLELGVGDLRFTRPEAAAFLNGTLRLGLAPEAVAALEAHTEGWIAGLQLAGLRLRGSTPPGPRTDGPLHPGANPGAGEPGPGADRLVVDYVVQEVLQQQPPATQRFLLQTALVERLSGPLCEALTGSGDGAAQLAALERANLFLVPLDAEGRWYRYHPLFAEALRAYLTRTEPAQVPEIHRRASAWYEGAGRPAEAVEHALAGEDWTRAVRLIAPFGPALAARGELRTLQRWMETLPEAILQASPELCLWYAWVLLFYQHVDACTLPLRAAEAGWTAAGTVQRLGEIATLRSAIAYFRDDTAGIIAWARQALRQLDPAPSFQRALATLYLCHGHLRAGDLAAARVTLATLPAPGAAPRGAPLAATSVFEDAELVAARIDLPAGALPQAARRYQAVLTSDRAGSRRAAIAARLGLGGVLREWNDLDGALQHVQQAIELYRQIGEELSLPAANLMLARVLAAQGAVAAAQPVLDTAVEQAQQVGAQQTQRQAAAYRARLWASLGRWAEANAWARASGLSSEEVPAYERQSEWLILARLRIAQGQAGRVVRGLQGCLRSAEAAGRQGDAVEVLALLALAYQAGGLWERAEATLARALALAAPGGYLRVFLDEGPALAALLGRVSSGRGAPAYAHPLLAAFGAAPTLAGARARSGADLSPRELDVLRLLAAGAGTAEIAATLGIGVNTVKKHLSHLYAKLDVTTRLGAVAEAHARELV